VSLSLQKSFEKELLDKSIKEVDLAQTLITLSDNSRIHFSYDEAWPGFSFLKGMGFDRIEFYTDDREKIEVWADRILQYQQDFLQDPDYLAVDDCHWNEKDYHSNQILISCHGLKSRKFAPQEIALDLPPMDAPLGVDPLAIAAFKNEIRNQKSEDTIHRIQNILVEFRAAKSDFDPLIWSNLVADLIAVSLENKLLSKASRLAEEHKTELKHAWDDTRRSIRLLSAYEPKVDELSEWANIFQSFNSEDIISFLSTHLSSKAGPQIVKLLNYRVQTEFESFIEICLHGNGAIQKLLLQWLSAYWKPQHYHLILAQLHRALKETNDLDMINYWVQALLRSYRSQALEDMRQFFSNKKWYQGFFKSKKNLELGPLEQRNFLKALSEHPSADILRFFAEIKQDVRGGLADEVERMIRSYQGNTRS